MNFKYKNLESYQQKVEVQLDDLPIPIIGYIDFLFKDTIVDLKTTVRMPSKPRGTNETDGFVFYGISKEESGFVFCITEDAQKIQS